MEVGQQYKFGEIRDGTGTPAGYSALLLDLFRLFSS
jgi:hypothetical protein